MGLDMMLYRKQESGDVEVGRWRKANAVHHWFVMNVQGGVDECQPSDVSREKMQEPDTISILENAEVDNSNLQALVLVTASGPGLTDVHGPTFTPIAELLENGESEEEIWESNREYFSEGRKQFLAKFK